MNNQSPNRASSGRVPALDGIRGLAILLVLIWHFFSGAAEHSSVAMVRVLYRATALTWSGVDLFFVLSGFLIGGILIDAKGSSNYFRVFYARRAFRILPIYLICCALYPLSSLWVANLADMVYHPMPWYAYATFTQNFFLAHHNWEYYLAATWSLAIEEQFYLVFPLVVWLCPRRWLSRVVAASVFVSMGARALLFWSVGAHWHNASYTLTACRADALMLGVACALIVRDRRAVEFLATHRKKLLLLASVLGVTAFAGFSRWHTDARGFAYFGFTWLAAFYALVLLATLTGGSRLRRLFEIAWLRWLGSIAYCLYLIHQPLYKLLFRLMSRPPFISGWSYLAPLAVSVAVTLIIAHFSTRYFEAPLLNFGRRKFAYANSQRVGQSTRTQAAVRIAAAQATT